MCTYQVHFSFKTVYPGFSQCTPLLCSNAKHSKKRAHSGCTPPKMVHPAAEMCAQGAPLLRTVLIILLPLSWNRDTLGLVLILTDGLQERDDIFNVFPPNNAIVLNI